MKLLKNVTVAGFLLTVGMLGLCYSDEIPWPCEVYVTCPGGQTAWCRTVGNCGSYGGCENEILSAHCWCGTQDKRFPCPPPI